MEHGAHPSAGLASYCDGLPVVIRSGAVDRLEARVRQAELLVAPLRAAEQALGDQIVERLGVSTMSAGALARLWIDELVAASSGEGGRPAPVIHGFPVARAAETYSSRRARGLDAQRARETPTCCGQPMGSNRFASGVRHTSLVSSRESTNDA